MHCRYNCIFVFIMIYVDIIRCDRYCEDKISKEGELEMLE